MEEYTNAELVALSEFRKIVEHILPDEFSKRNENLIRWIRARNLDLNKAEQMIIHSLNWRKNNEIDRILLEVVDEYMEKAMPYWLDARDRKGRLMWCMPFGSWDIRKTVIEDGPDRFTRHMTKQLERIQKIIREITEQDEMNGSNSTRALRFSMVVSLNGFSFSQLTSLSSVNAIMEQVGKYEAHYPESLEICYCVDAPGIFSVLFNLMKNLMTARTINKIHLFGSNRSQWEPLVRELVSPEQIYPQFGGTKELKNGGEK